LYAAAIHFNGKIQRHGADWPLEEVDQTTLQLGQMWQRPVELLLSDVEQVKVFASAHVPSLVYPIGCLDKVTGLNGPHSQYGCFGDNSPKRARM